jgi:hypothetical protein
MIRGGRHPSIGIQKPQPFGCSLDHVRRKVKSRDTSDERRQQARQASGARSQIHYIQAVQRENLLNSPEDVALMILPRDQGLIFVCVTGVDLFVRWQVRYTPL